MYSLSFAGAAGASNSPEKTTSSKAPQASSSLMPEVVPEIITEPSIDQEQTEVHAKE